MAKQDTQRDRRQYLKIEALKDRCFHMNILWGGRHAPGSSLKIQPVHCLRGK
jgi:hypothetical protein